MLVDLVPRVWPFLSHNISSVRKSSLNMLNTVFTEVNYVVSILEFITEAFV